VAYLSDRQDISEYAVTMTNLPKVGINPLSTFSETPLGVYFYPAEYYLSEVKGKRQLLPYQHRAKYIHILRFTTNKILYIDDIQRSEVVALINQLGAITGEQDFVNKMYKESEFKATVPTPGGQLWYVTEKLKNKIYLGRRNARAAVIWNWLFRQLGYDVVIDSGSGIIFENEPAQGFIVNPVGTYNVVARIDNISEKELMLKKMNSPNVSDQEKIDIIAERPELFSKAKNLSDHVQQEAMRSYPLLIRHVKNPSEAVQLAAVQTDADALESIKNPTEAVQLAAVQQNGMAIEWITDPSEAVQLTAVRQNARAIMHISNPAPKVLETLSPQMIKMWKDAQS
jgi:hypothetical protein